MLLDQIVDKQNRLGIGNAGLAYLVGCDKGLLGERLRGLRPLSNEDATRILGILTGIETLKERHKPLPLDLKDCVALKKLLDDLDEERRNPPKPLTPDEDALLTAWTEERVPLAQLAAEKKMSAQDMIHLLETLIRREQAIRQIQKVQLAGLATAMRKSEGAEV